jgi:transposase
MMNFSSHPIHLCCQPVDMRKSFDGLSAIVSSHFKMDPLRDGVFVFVNKDRDRIKLLVWDRHGYWLHYLRLEAGRFQMPPVEANGESSPEALSITCEQLLLIIEGIDLESVKRRKRYSLPRITT